MSDTSARGSTSGFAAFRHRDFIFAFSARLLNNMATRMLQVTIGWEVWRITQSELMLGYVGLAMFMPNILFFLAAGEAADRFSRRKILAITYSAQAVTALVLWFTFTGDDPAMGVVLGLLFVMGVGRTFSQPANLALIPNLVPKDVFPNAIAWANSGQHASTIVGPVLGGVLIEFGTEGGIGATPAFATVTILVALTALSIVMIRSRIQTMNRQPVTLETIFAGMKFIWNRQIILGAISLDLFAVLLGGATAMFPVFATDILHLGASGLGMLHAAFAVGEVTCALVLTQIPVRRSAGKLMFIVVAIYGFGILTFGLSEIVWLSLTALAIAGAADMVSVFIRHNMIQFATPDEMRGRVMAVHGVFVGGSGQLGEFESGAVAEFIGPVGSVVVGGVGTIVTVLIFTKLFPNLLQVDALDHDDILRISEEAAAARQTTKSA